MQLNAADHNSQVSVVDPEGVRGERTPIKTKLFHFHGEISGNREKFIIIRYN